MLLLAIVKQNFYNPVRCHLHFGAPAYPHRRSAVHPSNVLLDISKCRMSRGTSDLETESAGFQRAPEEAEMAEAPFVNTSLRPLPKHSSGNERMCTGIRI